MHSRKGRHEFARRRAAMLLAAGNGSGSSSGASGKDWYAMDVDTLSGHVLERFNTSRAPELFTVFYELNARWLAAHVARSIRLLHTRLNAFELASDVFHDIFRSAGTYVFQGGPAFRRWVCVLARNKIRKALRERRSRPLSLCMNGAELDDHGAGDPCRRMIQHEDLARVISCWWLLIRVCQAAILSTSPKEQEILRLHVLEGLSYRVLAERFSLTLSEVTARGRRSRRKVARFMQQYFRSSKFDVATWGSIYR